MGALVDQSPVFVVGSARSGTTALSHLIAAEMELACTPETNVMLILKRIERLHASMNFHEFCQKQSRFLMHGNNRNYSIVCPDELKNEKILDNPRAFSDLIISMDSYTDGSQILEQTPRNGEHLCMLRELYPDSLILFLVRNPFDVIQSKKNSPWGSSSALRLFCTWSLQYVELVALARSHGLRRVIIVRYMKLADTYYRTGLLRRIREHGVKARKESIKIQPRNYAKTDWSRQHLAKSTDSFKPRIDGKWTTTFPCLRKWGDNCIKSALKATRGAKPGLSYRLVLLGAWLSRNLTKR